MLNKMKRSVSMASVGLASAALLAPTQPIRRPCMRPFSTVLCRRESVWGYGLGPSLTFESRVLSQGESSQPEFQVSDPRRSTPSVHGLRVLPNSGWYWWYHATLRLAVLACL